MNFIRFKRLFRATHVADDGKPIPFEWVADPSTECATLINPASGRMLAYVSHDGHGKYHRRVVVSPWRAVGLIRSHAGYLASLLSFPGMTVELLGLKVDTLQEAQDSIDEMLSG